MGSKCAGIFVLHHQICIFVWHLTILCSHSLARLILGQTPNFYMATSTGILAQMIRSIARGILQSKRTVIITSMTKVRSSVLHPSSFSDFLHWQSCSPGNRSYFLSPCSGSWDLSFIRRLDSEWCICRHGGKCYVEEKICRPVCRTHSGLWLWW